MIKPIIKQAYRTLTGFFLLILFFSFNAPNSQEPLSTTHLSFRQSCLKLNTVAKLPINCLLTNNLISEYNSARKQEGIKDRLFCCIYFSASDFLTKSDVSKRLTLPIHFLSKPFLNIEILSSRNHPPTT